MVFRISGVPLSAWMTTRIVAEPRHAISGGGGISSAGGVTVAGTLGQPAPGYSDGGGYQLSGGFWLAAPLVSDRIFIDGFQGASP